VVGFLIMIITGGYLFTLWQQILVTTIDGEDQLPNFLDLKLDWQELWQAYWHYLVLVFICFGPAIACNFVSGEPDWLRYTFISIGCFYFPMVLLAYSLTDSFAVASPVFIIRSILRAPLAYACLGILFGSLLTIALLPSPEGALPQSGVTSLRKGPLFYLYRVLAPTIGFYLSFVWMRWLGLFYRCYRDRLNWR
jgi:hypothetical protein